MVPNPHCTKFSMYLLSLGVADVAKLLAGDGLELIGYSVNSFYEFWRADKPPAVLFTGRLMGCHRSFKALQEILP